MFESFLGTFPVEELETAINVDAVILGVPYEDGSKIYPKGTALAPDTIRQISNQFSGQSFSEQNIHQKNVLDIGNVKISKNFDRTFNSIRKKVEEILRKKTMPIILGGDHSIAFGTANGIINSKQKIDSIVWIDAHLDLMNKYPNDESFTRATVLRRIFELEGFDALNYYFIGSRGHNLGIEEIDFLNTNKMNVLEAAKIVNYSVIDNFLRDIKANNLYVSLDIDVLDPAFAPGVSVPEPGGLSSKELFYIISKLASRISCFEIVEVNPKLDKNNLTAMVACKVIFELLDNF